MNLAPKVQVRKNNQDQKNQKFGSDPCGTFYKTVNLLDFLHKIQQSSASPDDYSFDYSSSGGDDDNDSDDDNTGAASRGNYSGRSNAENDETSSLDEDYGSSSEGPEWYYQLGNTANIIKKLEELDYNVYADTPCSFIIGWNKPSSEYKHFYPKKNADWYIYIGNNCLSAIYKQWFSLSGIIDNDSIIIPYDKIQIKSVDTEMSQALKISAGSYLYFVDETGQFELSKGAFKPYIPIDPTFISYTNTYKYIDYSTHAQQTVKTNFKQFDNKFDNTSSYIEMLNGKPYNEALLAYNTSLYNSYVADVTKINADLSNLYADLSNLVNSNNIDNVKKQVKELSEDLITKKNNYLAAQYKLIQQDFQFPSNLYVSSDLSQGCIVVYNYSQITGAIISSGVKASDTQKNRYIITSGYVKQPQDILEIMSEINGLEEIKTSINVGTYIPDPKLFINDYVAYVTKANGWDLSLVMISGIALNSDKTKVMNIEESTLSGIMDLIKEEYGNTENINLFKLSGTLRLKLPETKYGFISGMSPMIKKQQEYAINGRNLSLPIGANCYNRNIEYIKLNANKAVSFNIDPWTNYYAKRLYNKVRQSKLFSVAASYVTSQVFWPKTGNYVMHNLSSALSGLDFATQPSTIIYDETEINYKCFLIALENIIKNRGYKVQLYQTKFKLQGRNKVEIMTYPSSLPVLPPVSNLGIQPDEDEIDEDELTPLEKYQELNQEGEEQLPIPYSRQLLTLNPLSIYADNLQELDKKYSAIKSLVKDTDLRLRISK